ncbi:hypothetical protein F2Q68_00023247 [Brassica cretica]|uniref:Uncharacterized protein n=2 Tax=Brassica cretica TaxID=69181 RepID=A0A3N6R9A0_BRACR|nr:hypothetical protein F2Q68_00023247 [Brassica cretica]KAF3568098.1 hypothetical protein DY000_02019682 [Brassica cretica]
MREASMKREKRPITVPPFTTEVSNTIHLPELMAPPLLHLITTKKPKIEPMTQTLLPGEIGGKVLCITKRTNLTSPLDFSSGNIWTHSYP